MKSFNDNKETENNNPFDNITDEQFEEFLICSMCLVISAFTQLPFVSLYVEYDILDTTILIITVISTLVLRYIVCLIVNHFEKTEDSDDPYKHLIK